LLRSRRIVQIAAGTSYSLFLDDQGVVYSTGDNINGQLGQGDREFRNAPTTLRDLLGTKAVYISTQGLRENSHSLVVFDDGSVSGFGGNAHGQLGAGDHDARSRPTRINALDGIRVIKTFGGSRFSIFLTSDGSLYSVGNNSLGQLGTSDGISHSLPIQIPLFKAQNMTIVSSGYDATLVLQNNICFGKRFSDPEVCSGIGKCVGGNQCDCNGTHFGQQCQDWSCGGIVWTDPRACSYSGVCSRQNMCTCQFLALGIRCDVIALQISVFGYLPFILIALVPFLMVASLDLLLLYANCICTNPFHLVKRGQYNSYLKYATPSEKKKLTLSLVSPIPPSKSDVSPEVCQ
jgi:hypothetical protein